MQGGSVEAAVAVAVIFLTGVTLKSKYVQDMEVWLQL